MVGSALRAVEKGPLEEDLDSWRGIMLSDSSLKVFSGILAARLWAVLSIEVLVHGVHGRARQTGRGCLVT